MRAKLVQHINEVKQFKDPLDTMDVGMRNVIKREFKEYCDHSCIKVNNEHIPIAAKEKNIKLLSILKKAIAKQTNKKIKKVNEIEERKDPLDAIDVGLRNVIEREMLADNAYIGIQRFVKDISKDILIWSVRRNKLNYVKYLVKNGYDIHAQNDKALITACYYNYLDIVKYLVENGADIHAKNDVPLRRAINYGHLNVVKYLVEKGAYVNVLNGQPIKDAIANGYEKIAKYLVKNGANIKYWINYKRAKKVNEIEQRKDPLDAMDVGLGAIIRKGAEETGVLQVYWCVKNGKLSYLKYLVKHDYTNLKEPNLFPILFNNTLKWSIQFGHLNIVKYLIEELNDNLHIDYNKLLRYAIKFIHFDIVKYLVEEKNTEVTHELWIWVIQNYQGKKLESKDILKYLEKQYKENES